MTVPQVLEQLRATPKRLREITTGVPPETLRTPPAPDEWSANDVLADLRPCSDRWGTLRLDRHRDHPQLRATNPVVWITKTDYPDLEFAPSLRAFVRQRKALLTVLDRLEYEDWLQTGTLVGAEAGGDDGSQLRRAPGSARAAARRAGRQGGHRPDRMTPCVAVSRPAAVDRLPTQRFVRPVTGTTSG